MSMCAAISKVLSVRGWAGLIGWLLWVVCVCVCSGVGPGDTVRCLIAGTIYCKGEM